MVAILGAVLARFLHLLLDPVRLQEPLVVSFAAGLLINPTEAATGRAVHELGHLEFAAGSLALRMGYGFLHSASIDLRLASNL